MIVLFLMVDMDEYQLIMIIEGKLLKEFVEVFEWMLIDNIMCCYKGSIVVVMEELCLLWCMLNEKMVKYGLQWFDYLV